MLRWLTAGESHGPSLVALGVIPFATVALVTCVVTLFFPGQILGAAYDLDGPTADAVGLAMRMNSLATLVLVCLAVLVVAFALPLMRAMQMRCCGSAWSSARLRPAMPRLLRGSVGWKRPRRADMLRRC